MFRKFHTTKKIDLSCPYCGHVQPEPASVISSFCRDCGEHFRVKRGVAFPNPGLRVSGISELRVSKDRETDMERERPDQRRTPEGAPAENKLLAAETPDREPEDEETAWLASAEDDETAPHPLVQAPKEEEESAGIDAGNFFGFVDDEAPPLEEETAESNAPPPPVSLGEQAQGKESLAEGTFAALIQNQLPAIRPPGEKMPPNYVPPEQRRRVTSSPADFEVRCFRCYHLQHVSRFAKSTQCERCSVYISLANYEITAPKSHTLRTRGDIVIARRGGLRDCEIACHHLTVHGAIDARVDCSGDAVFRRSGVVRGSLFCRKLILEKNARVEFPDGAMTGRAEIHGHFSGNLTCSGTTRILRTGVLEGNLVTADLDLKEGGRVTGATTIDPGTSTELPAKMGFNPTIIG